MKIIGYKRNDFTSKEGAVITGMNLYLAYPVAGPEAEGMVAERIDVSDGKLAKCGYKPRVGDEVTVVYNRYGKPEAITKV